MPELVEPLGHQDLIAGLVRSARENRMPHALLFDGLEGVGKFRAALWLAGALLCERGGDVPCLVCGSCKRIQSDSHADLFVIDHRAHAQNAITVDFIAPREGRPKDGYRGPPVEQFLALRAAEGRGKYIVVREAEAMLEEAQNAFLKMLEEPRPGVHLFLETSSAGSLLATVRSRVVPVQFGRLTLEQCEEVLWRQKPFRKVTPENQEAVTRLVRIAGGSPGLALRLHKRAAPAMQVLIGDALLGKRSAGDISRELFELKGEFPGKTPAAERRTRARIALDVGLEVLTDLERAVAGVDPDQLPHGLVAGPIAASGRFSDASSRRRIGEAWLRAREDLGLNLSPEGLIDRALLSVPRHARQA
ncbi:DNA polymerase III subunit tau [Planctomycetes bacterium Poly30]|uniref:DNA polymerase III subunit tau n=1 Tax=Saltatorellus ferox TaxID=2528018 RepID=A0A518ES09_9BACT|nr:DNA polymerase III subunit tau [Planctomycetes bacterium Poly30]